MVSKKIWKSLFAWFLGTTFIFIFLFCFKKTGYSFFVEFADVYGVKIGTPIRTRGVYVGSVQAIRLKPNSVLVLVKINSAQTIILSNSIIETSQTGLLNESVIDIIPLDRFVFSDPFNNPLSSFCDTSMIVCNNTYVLGDRGLNYDDLIRSTTRISQRFDDPRVFSLLYIFLRNITELADVFIEFTEDVLDLFTVSCLHFQRG